MDGTPQAALDTAVHSEKAPALFDAAADKFQEVSAHGARRHPGSTAAPPALSRFP
jgi:hypothetical protein